ncbi:CAAX amino terminal protease family [Rheinheimera sp. A13L]|uniref:CPBP family intramembrane glutamic endopeptidase n=1 Tax=Rheinheimera sp. A13L TaxID=506534 RepID=UPI000212509F|nr:CAAX amino terminal protease family [Rheinheimera sp. A13L]
MINERVSYEIGSGITGVALIVIGYFFLFDVVYNSFLFFYKSIYLHEYVSLRGSGDFDFVSSLIKLIVTFILVLCICISNRNRCGHILGFEVVSFKCFSLCVGCVFLYFSLYDFLRCLFGGTSISRLFVDDRLLESDTYKIFLAFFFVCLIVPACEEIFFRGYLIRYLLDRMLNKHFCVVFSSMLFTAFHYNYSSPFLFEVFTVSSMIGYAGIVSGSVYPCMVMHGTYNSVFFL